MLKIIDKIQKEHVFEGVKASDKENLFKIISEKISEVTKQSKDSIFEALTKREAEYTTDIGNSVAVPHGRIKGYGKTDIFVIFLDEILNYDSSSSPDGSVGVKLLFVIICDEDNPEEYLANLSQLFFIVNQKTVLEKILVAKNYDDLVTHLETSSSLEHKYETEKQIKFLIELERADMQIKSYELYASTHLKQKSDAVLEEYKKYKETLMEKIDVAVLENYNRIKDSKGNALAKIDNYKCSVCNVAIPKMTVNEVRRQNQIIPCFHCGRILFTAD